MAMCKKSDITWDDIETSGTLVRAQRWANKPSENLAGPVLPVLDGEAIATRLEAIAIGLEAVASRLQDIALRGEAISTFVMRPLSTIHVQVESKAAFCFHKMMTVMFRS